LAEAAGLEYHAVSTGKIRRYLNLKSVSANCADMFRVVKGLGDARKIIKKLKPDIIFSKGGFVSVPVVIAAKSARVPVVIHESDLTPGLANKAAYPFAKKICAAFEDTLEYLPKNKGVFTGTPIRGELLNGNGRIGLRFLGYPSAKPILLIMGGSSGSVVINKCVDEVLRGLLLTFNIVHLRGRNNLTAFKHENYRQFEYLNKELPNILAAADIVVSRAGSNTINELLALRKPNLLIPLSKKASRGDQIQNAASFEKRGYSAVLAEDEMTADRLVKKINSLYSEREKYAEVMEKTRKTDAVSEIAALLYEIVNIR
jgi:UDP-N-acetylglucosamine--N-acetylmuramyl-(pentapeptide) pyrophosphoryl-undecaprenol N-acetylglucosamine transferase